MGIHIISLETFGLSLESGLLLATNAFDEFFGLKTSLVMVFVF